MTTSFARRARSVAALCAGAALLGLSACGPTEETPTSPPADDAPTETSQEDPQDQDPASDEDGTGEDGGTGEDDSAGADEGAGQDGTGTGAAGDLTRIVLVTEVKADDGHGEGDPVLAADQLAALLADPFGGSAECSGELALAPDSAAVDCTGPQSMDSTEATQEWVANAVRVPVESGLEDGFRFAVLFSTGTALPEEADDLLDDDVLLTGVGMGSMFGAEPLSATELAESTLATLTSDNAYVPVAEMAEWSDVTCEDGLDFAVFETVDCAATTADGATWDLAVAPGTYADNDHGLLVGIETPREG